MTENQSKTKKEEDPKRLPKKKKLRNSMQGIKMIERALLTKRGIRLSFTVRKSAVAARFQVHLARQFEIQSLLDLYPPGDERRYNSAYSDITTMLDPGKDCWHLSVIRGAAKELDQILNKAEEL